MILTAFHGFCMALADSVPGVSGGTIAFILGFYDRFINALHGLFRGNWKQRKAALTYLLKLGIGWGIGMVSCVVLLSSLFEQNIYFMSSLFLGLTVCSIPFVAMAEQEALENWRNSGFLLVGVAAVVGLTLLRTHAVGLGVINYTQLQPLQFGWIFLSGAVAITAMVLPGISGSSVLLIAGVLLISCLIFSCFFGSILCLRLCCRFKCSSALSINHFIRSYCQCAAITFFFFSGIVNTIFEPMSSFVTV